MSSCTIGHFWMWLGALFSISFMVVGILLVDCGQRYYCNDTVYTTPSGSTDNPTCCDPSPPFACIANDKSHQYSCSQMTLFSVLFWVHASIAIFLVIAVFLVAGRCITRDLVLSILDCRRSVAVRDDGIKIHI